MDIQIKYYQFTYINRENQRKNQLRQHQITVIDQERYFLKTQKKSLFPSFITIYIRSCQIKTFDKNCKVTKITNFGYMEELERKKMFMMIRLGHLKDPSRLLPVHNYNKIPVLPKKKRRKNNKTPSPKVSPLKVALHNPNDISLPALSTRVHEDPYQMSRIHNTTKQKLDQKQRRLNVINKRILNKFSIE